jgi:predicted transcriptional regulator
VKESEKGVSVTIELDPATLERVQALAKEQKKTLQEAAACLLEKGIAVSEDDSAERD